MKQTQPHPGLQLRRLPLATLNPAAYNPRQDLQPGDEAYDRLSQSIDEFGLVEPLIWNERTGNLVGGHQRLKVLMAQDINESDVVVVDLSPTDEKRLNVFLNDVTGTWDFPKLDAVIKQVLDEGGTLELMQDTDAALQAALAEIEKQLHSGEINEVDPPPPPPTPVTQPGDLWLLGRHRLLNGDCTDEANWQRLMRGEQAQLICTDPPYAVNYVGGRAAQIERLGKKRQGIEEESDAYWDQLSDAGYCDLLIKSLTLAHKFSDDKSPLYLWFASAHLHDVLHCLAQSNWHERNLLVWVKNNGAGALFAQYKHWYEPCFYGHKLGKSCRWHGPTNERTVWEHDKPLKNDLHPTMKPVALIARSIENSTKPGELVVDPFMGSGTAIVAAEQIGRRAYGMDLDSAYCDVIVKRWQELTGQEAILEGSGETFAQVAQARGIEVT